MQNGVYTIRDVSRPRVYREELILRDSIIRIAFLLSGSIFVICTMINIKILSFEFLSSCFHFAQEMSELLLDAFDKNHTDVLELLLKKETISNGNTPEIPEDREELDPIFL